MSSKKKLDAVVVGAGFGGMIMLHLLSQRGMQVQGFERGSDVGGTWYWNRYPGCRCDVESMEYSYQFSKDLQQEWDWSERYSPQPEILAYAGHVADRFKLRDLIEFDQSVSSAHYSDTTQTWQVDTASGTSVECRYLIMATGCLSAANTPAFPGLETFAGEQVHTGAWPQAGVDFTGKTVGVIGTGSSAIQSIPLIAAQAASLTVFQRTPNYSVPAQNGPLDPAFAANIKANYADLNARNREQPAAFGANFPRNFDSILQASPAEQQARLEEYWQHGGFMFLAAFGDVGQSLEANAIAAEFVRNKIRQIVDDPKTAELLCPETVLGCKRLCADTGYYATYNRENVSLVDVAKEPIQAITPQGVQVGGTVHAIDTLVFATGFDAMTGSLLGCDIRGKQGLRLQEKWAAGPRTYLGLMSAGFPNFFMMTGPGSPSVLANMITGVEHHAQYIAQLIDWMGAAGHQAVEASRTAEDAWVERVNMRADATLYPQCNSWYLGANVPGKPRVFMPYIGFPDYVEQLEGIAERNYEGFAVS